MLVLGVTLYIFNLSSFTVIHLIVPHKDTHVLILRICKYVTLNNERDFGDVTMFKKKKKKWDVEMILDYTDEPKVITRILIREMQRQGDVKWGQAWGQAWEVGASMRERKRERESWRYYTAELENRGRSHNKEVILLSERGKEIDSSLKPPGETQWC